MRYAALLIILLFSYDINSQELLKVKSGQAHFISNAPLEIIEAVSEEVQGFLRPSDQSFAFKLMITSFEGFNSELQRQHFNDHYMEVDQYRDASFSGKIIEEVNFAVDGEYTVRAKGKLSIHGVTKERIINCKLVVKNQMVSAHAYFSVLLEDHDISIPRIVYQKIAEEIFIDVEVVFQSR